MPHISIKMLEGRSEEEKALAVQKVTQAICEAFGCPDIYVSVAVKDYTPQEWQEVFAEEIQGSGDLRKKPGYDPRDLL